MNDADRAALDAWRTFRDAEQMASRAAEHFPISIRRAAADIREAAFEEWTTALDKARAPLDVATLKGGR